ncbi:MAG TPA: CpsB/CapC family capsule biosynthesis tyrosine phosphatase [Gemmatimonadaceae bacterium]|nr:CpsB/CapC family capsule biosynthesis tyrosine phosphatase [Gemmatimonadaceae bacterium]
MIDIHTHLMPGVDDGARTVEASLQVLERFARSGVTTVVCTPHLLATDAEALDTGGYDEAFGLLVAAAPPVPALERGWEIMLDAPGVDLHDPRLGLAGSRSVLVEFPRMNVPAGATAELRRIANGGLIPVLAHPERYWGCTPQRIDEWRAAGAVIQMDAAMLLGNGPVGKLARAMLERGQVDVIASDNHGDVRSLGAARRWLEEMGAEEQTSLLTRANAERLLASERPLPVPPMPRLTSGVLGRLKSLLLGK